MTIVFKYIMEKCEKCGITFNYLKNLKRHVRENRCNNKHEIKCPLCAILFSRYQFLREHLTSQHNLELNEEEKRFRSMDEFLDWKRTIEADNICEYVRRNQTTLKNDQKRYYLRCHRSGYFKSESSGKRRLKSQGSNKIESVCPSLMVVTECNNESGDDKVHVVFWPIHAGHSLNIGRCRLNDNDRVMIAGDFSFY